jgi:predicted nucleotidyltransferase
MRKQAAIARLRSKEDAVRALGATSLYLYGSTARDEARDDSDIDVLIDFESGTGFSLLNIVGIKQKLEEELGVEVDLATRDALHPRLRNNIESSAIKVF